MRKTTLSLLVFVAILGGILATTSTASAMWPGKTIPSFPTTTSITKIPITGTWTITMPWTSPTTVPTKITPRPTKVKPVIRPLGEMGNNAVLMWPGKTIPPSPTITSITTIPRTGTWTITMPWTTPTRVPTKITPRPTKARLLP